MKQKKQPVKHVCLRNVHCSVSGERRLEALVPGVAREAVR